MEHRKTNCCSDGVFLYFLFVLHHDETFTICRSIIAIPYIDRRRSARGSLRFSDRFSLNFVVVGYRCIRLHLRHCGEAVQGVPPCSSRAA
jgi:hypothetical protein